MYKRRDEMPCAMIERDMVRMARDAGLVEGYEDVNGSGRLLIAFRFHGIRKIRCKSRGQKRGDFRLVPRTRH